MCTAIVVPLKRPVSDCARSRSTRPTRRNSSESHSPRVGATTEVAPTLGSASLEGVLHLHQQSPAWDALAAVTRGGECPGSRSLDRVFPGEEADGLEYRPLPAGSAG